MAFIDERTTRLNPEQIEKFVLDHLPYRIKILDNVVNYRNKNNKDPFWPSIYESAQITCRMFIQFFGLRVEGKDNPKLIQYKEPYKKMYYSKDGKNSYEVKIKDLGIDFIQLNELSDEERNVLAHAYESGSIATAHLTFETPFVPEPEKVIKASALIKRIIENKIKNKSS